MDSFDADIRAIERIDAVPLILDMICRTTGMGFAAVARVTEDRWIACSVKDSLDFGLKAGSELEIATTICNEIRQSHEGVVFDNADEDPVFAGHHTPRIYGLKSYISLPIILHDGSFFGTLCAIDPQPHRVNTPEVIGMFKLFADLIAEHLKAQDRLDVSEARLDEAHEASDLREQFIAVLGHDLRNPLGAIGSGASILKQTVTDERSKRIVAMIEQSSRRMSELIENLLDFARGRMGGGVVLSRERHVTLEPVLQQVIDELRVAWPEREVQTAFDFRAPVSVDGARIGQMVSNLLGNAFHHGDPGKPVALKASSQEGMLVVTVSNGGAPIPPLIKARLFQPFARGEVNREQQGLGLGLYIASEIATAHGGELTVDSTVKETVFRFRMAG